MNEDAYQKRTGRNADFRVRYIWLPQQGSKHPQKLFQHIRCDWCYEVEDPDYKGNFMIWPEFEDENGIALSELTVIPDAGEASMWIVSLEMRSYHRNRIRIGVKGFFVCGSQRIAAAEVIGAQILTDDIG